jgi:hypothetical protein
LSEVADAKPLVDVRNVRWLSYLSKSERHKKSQAAGFQMAVRKKLSFVHAERY